MTSITSHARYRARYTSIFRKTGLHASVHTLYERARPRLGAHAVLLRELTQLIANRGYSHATRFARFDALLRPSRSSLSAAERTYVADLLTTSSRYLQTQVQKGRTIHAFASTARGMYLLRERFQMPSGYALFERRTAYLVQPEPVVSSVVVSSLEHDSLSLPHTVSLPVTPRTVPCAVSLAPPPSLPKVFVPDHSLEDNIVLVDFRTRARAQIRYAVGIVAGIVAATVLTLSAVLSSSPPSREPRIDSTREFIEQLVYSGTNSSSLESRALEK